MPVVFPARPTGLTSEAAQGREELQKELECMRLEEQIHRAWAALTSGPPSSTYPVGLGGIGPISSPPRADQDANIDVLFAQIEMDPSILARCPRLRHLLQKYREAKEMASRHEMLQEWERRYGTPQIPTPSGGGGGGS